MKTLSMFLLFALSIAAYGQQPAAGQPDTSGERLKQLLRAADEFEQAGKSDQAADARQKADRERQALLAHIDSLQAELDRLRPIAGGVPQVIVHLKMYEVSMTKLRRLGYNLAKLQGKPITSPDGTVLGFSMAIDRDGDTAQFLDSLRKTGLAKVLAEPTLTTVSGHNATFVSGGKILLPQPKKDGTNPLEWRQYGTQVQLTPRVLSDRKVSLSFQLELSSLDYTHSVQVGKESYPGLNTIGVSTSSEFHDGETVVLGGLNQVRIETANASSVPVVSSIPYIGSAFTTVKEERNELATFVLVQPEIVQAGNADDAAAARQPSDNDTQR